MPRIKKLTDYTYSPTNPASEDAIRLQIDDAIQEVYDASAKNTDTVNLTGAQTIADVKTFTDGIKVPVASAVDNPIRKDTFETHKTSSDHDGRYFTEAEVNALLLANQQGNHTGTWQGYNPTATDPMIQNIVDTHTRQISDMHINVKDYGVIGGGSNETVAIQSVLNLGGHIIFPAGEYLFDQLQITQNDTTLEFLNGVVLKSSYAGDSLNLGSIEIKGTNISEHLITTDVAENTNLIVVADASLFTVGDFVYIKQTDPVGTDLATHRKKHLYCVCTISGINTGTNTLTVNEIIPHSFQVENAAKVTKFIPIKNIKIIGNNTIFDKMGTTQYANHFYVEKAYNFEMSGIIGTNGGGKLITTSYLHTFHISDLIHKNPTNVSEGHGYGVQVGYGSCYGVVERVQGYGLRHLVDIPNGANNILIKDCFGYSSPISGHGQNAKHIKVLNCFCYNSGFSVGNTTFLSDEKWIFENCTSMNRLDGNGFGVSAESFDIDIINCSVYNCLHAVSTIKGSNVRIINMFVDYTTGSVISIETSSHDILIKNILIKDARLAVDGTIIIKDDSYNIIVEDSDITTRKQHGVYVLTSTVNFESKVKVKNTKITNNSTYTSTKTSVYSDNPTVYIDGCDLKSRVNLTNVNGKYRFTNNDIDNIPVLIMATKNTMVANNMGVASTWTVPTHNGTDLIVVNNIIAFV